MEPEILKARDVPEVIDASFKQSKGSHVEQGKIFPHKAISPAHTVWALYLLGSVPGPRTILLHPNGRL